MSRIGSLRRTCHSEHHHHQHLAAARAGARQLSFVEEQHVTTRRAWGQGSAWLLSPFQNRQSLRSTSTPEDVDSSHRSRNWYRSMHFMRYRVQLPRQTAPYWQDSVGTTECRGLFAETPVRELSPCRLSPSPLPRTVLGPVAFSLLCYQLTSPTGLIRPSSEGSISLMFREKVTDETKFSVLSPAKALFACAIVAKSSRLAQSIFEECYRVTAISSETKIRLSQLRRYLVCQTYEIGSKYPG
ncbi:hypothetical protein FN846DRAFT_360784 [Sphaerosporella brunnea]|uniref:Uncharacterized protein n=1 Tax=Sphaerosporella brunnea TaxID=1250544 RepID=A0A5J5F6F8_9PEZI|nr:hypothetical protein FN846DRAFT_360784 [Sphaerosporella brunnea]